MGIDGEGGAPCPGLFISCPDFWSLNPSTCTCGPPSSQPLWKLTDFINFKEELSSVRRAAVYFVFMRNGNRKKAMFTYLPAPATSLWGSISHAQINFVIKLTSVRGELGSLETVRGVCGFFFPMGESYIQLSNISEESPKTFHMVQKLVFF